MSDLIACLDEIARSVDPTSALVRAWQALAGVRVLQARARGQGTFRADGDRWIDDPDVAGLHDDLDRAIGQVVRRGEPAARAQIAALATAIDALKPSPSPPFHLHRRLVLGQGDPAEAPDIRVILGDNRDALDALHAAGERFDAALEDPPYDTGHDDLPYRDRWPPGAWRSMLRGHLKRLHRVLAPHGFLAMHIDENGLGPLQALLDEVFTPANVLGLQVWDKRNPKGDSAGLAHQHELIAWAARDRRVLKRHGGLTRRKAHAVAMLARAAQLVAAGDLPEARASWARHVASAPDLSAGERAYRFLDDLGRPYRPVSMAWPNRTLPPPPFFAPLIHPVTGQPCPVPARGWRNSPETMAGLLAEGRILFGVDHRTQPTRKYLLQEVAREAMPSVLYYAGSDDRLLEDLGLRFPHAKPLALLDVLLDAVPPDGHVFDGFGGSGSLAHAVLEHNRQLGTRLRATLCEADPAVAEGILIPRLRQVIGPGVTVAVVEVRYG